MSETDVERGLELSRAGRLAEAEQVWLAVLRRQPEQFDALHLTGVIAAVTGRPELAVERIGKAIAIRPDVAEAHNDLGNALRNLGRFAEALASYDRALASRPDFAEVHENRGNVLRDLGRDADALASYDMAIALCPDLAGAHTSRGNVLAAQRRYEAALASYDAALASRPDFTAAYNNRGNVLCDLGCTEAALTSYDTAIALRPDFAEAHNNRGNALQDLGDFTAAQASYDKAIALKPGFADAWCNRGNVLTAAGESAAALESYDRAIELNPESVAAYANQSLCYLGMGEYERGWEMYEWRWHAGWSIPRHDLRGLPWPGDGSIAGKTILVHAEQGLGDTLQFCRYIPMLAARATVVLEVQRPLVRLLSGLNGVSGIVANGDPLPRIDAWIPMLSLPLAFRTTLATVLAEVPYLHADPERVAAWRERLAGLPGHKVGLVWAGSARLDKPRGAVLDRRRSFTLERYAPLAAIPGLHLISLQKGQGSIAVPDGMVLHDWTDELNDFADTAALVEALDLVISVDTSVVHLAGALGKPVWVLNRYDQCWRWLRDRTDSPWYPTARLFRQPTPGDWSSVLREVSDALRAGA